MLECGLAAALGEHLAARAPALWVSRFAVSVLTVSCITRSLSPISSGCTARLRKDPVLPPGVRMQGARVWTFFECEEFLQLKAMSFTDKETV